ncbi:MAG: translation initiation factor eIF-2B [Thermoplasmatota archaeon]
MSGPEMLLRRVEGIGKDNESGAAELTLAAIELLGEFREAGDSKLAVEILLKLLDQKPTMAPLVNLVNGSLLAMDDGVPLPDFLAEFQNEIESGSRMVSDIASSMVADGYRIMTYSNSSTLMETFRKAAADGREFEVVLSEARPVREGIIMAEALKNLGIGVDLVADSALFQEMEEVHMVMVGADALSHKYLVNKIGTRGLAAQARLLGKDLIAVAGSVKVLPSGIDNYRKVLRPPDEIAEKIEGVNITNYYFDQTPLHLVTRVVTEKGPMGPFEIMEAASGKKVHGLVREHFSSWEPK